MSVYSSVFREEQLSKLLELYNEETLEAWNEARPIGDLLLEYYTSVNKTCHKLLDSPNTDESRVSNMLLSSCAQVYHTLSIIKPIVYDINDKEKLSKLGRRLTDGGVQSTSVKKVKGSDASGGSQLSLFKD